MSDTHFPVLPAMADLLSKIAAHFHTAKKSNNPTKDAGYSGVPQTAAEYRPQDYYHYIRQLADSSEGEIGLVRSGRTGKLLIAKHTKARQRVRPGCCPVYRYPEEAKTLLKLLRGTHHPNVIRLFGVEASWEPGRHMLLLECCTGGDLLDQLRHFSKMSKHAYGSSQHLLVRNKLAIDVLAHPPIAGADCLVPEVFVLHVFVGLVRALAFIHDSEEHEAIIHGDIKPDNILLRWSPQNECGLPDIVLADFGASQLASESWGISGTVGYDSPEVLEVSSLKRASPREFERRRNSRVMSTKSDIYQLGHVIYLMAALDRWETGADPDALILSEEYTTTYSRHLATLIAWCLAVKLAERPSAKAGLLPVIQGFQEQRDRLFRERGPLPKTCWSSLKM